ncbi:glyoxalase bleomycin resistance protein dioxygenase [Botrytis cinerea]
MGYSEMICANNDALIDYDSDYPYFWLKKLSDGQTPIPTHIAFDAPDREAVDRFREIALQIGGRDNGAPGI